LQPKIKISGGKHKMKNEMRLQGIGLVEGTEAGNIQVGDILRWNHGGLSRVVSFELTKTGKTIICQVEVINSRTGEKEMYERKMRTSRLVNIVASANTNNDFNLIFKDDVEEMQNRIEERLANNEKHLEEKRKVKVIQIEEATETELKKSVHEISYRVTDHGTYVEVMLFVTDIANDVTLVAQQEGEFETMAEAETLIAYLKKTGNKIEFVETMAYTG
jgi:hypothetical protein